MIELWFVSTQGTISVSYTHLDVYKRQVLEVLGAVDTEVFSALLRQVLAKDVTGAIRTVDHLVDQGRDVYKRQI